MDVVLYPDPLFRTYASSNPPTQSRAPHWELSCTARELPPLVPRLSGTHPEPELLFL